MRDGVKLCVDVYRPDTGEKLPALLAFAIYNKDFQGPDMAEALPPQPAWTPLWTVSRLQCQDGAAQDLSRREPAFASAVAGDPECVRWLMNECSSSCVG